MFQNNLTTIEKVIFLKSVNIFAHATIEQLGQIAGLTEEVYLEPGRAIFIEGQQAEALYLLISGRVLLQKNGQPVSEIGDGEPLGTLGVLDFHPRFYTATAIDHVHALKLNGSDFHELLSMDIEIVKAVFKVLCRRVREGR